MKLLPYLIGCVSLFYGAWWGGSYNCRRRGHSSPIGRRYLYFIAIGAGFLWWAAP